MRSRSRRTAPLAKSTRANRATAGVSDSQPTAGQPAVDVRRDSGRGGRLDLRELLGQVASHAVPMILLELLQPCDLGLQLGTLLRQVAEHGRAMPLELGAHLLRFHVGRGQDPIGLRTGRRPQLFRLSLARRAEPVRIGLRRGHDRGSLGPRLIEELVRIPRRDLKQPGGCAGAVRSGGAVLVFRQHSPYGSMPPYGSRAGQRNAVPAGKDEGMDVLSSRVVVRPADPARSHRFYRDTLGLAVYREFGSSDAPGVVFFLGNGLLEVSGRTTDPRADAIALWMQVRDVHAEHRRLRDAGVPILREPRREPWGLVELWIEDPDKIPIVLVEVPDDHPLRQDQRSIPAHEG